MLNEKLEISISIPSLSLQERVWRGSRTGAGRGRGHQAGYTRSVVAAQDVLPRVTQSFMHLPTLQPVRRRCTAARSSQSPPHARGNPLTLFKMIIISYYYRYYLLLLLLIDYILLENHVNCCVFMSIIPDKCWLLIIFFIQTLVENEVVLDPRLSCH